MEFFKKRDFFNKMFINNIAYSFVIKIPVKYSTKWSIDKISLHLDQRSSRTKLILV